MEAKSQHESSKSKKFSCEVARIWLPFTKQGVFLVQSENMPVAFIRVTINSKNNQKKHASACETRLVPAIFCCSCVYIHSHQKIVPKPRFPPLKYMRPPKDDMLDRSVRIQQNKQQTPLTQLLWRKTQSVQEKHVPFPPLAALKNFDFLFHPKNGSKKKDLT